MAQKSFLTFLENNFFKIRKNLAGIPPSTQIFPNIPCSSKFNYPIKNAGRMQGKEERIG